MSVAILGSAVVLVAVAWRFRGDEWLEWYTVGMRATLLRGRDNPLRLSFRRYEYSAAWHDVNPRAVASRADLP